MTFDVSGNAYDNFMGRYARELAPAFADFSGVHDSETVLDVGCGSGILTAELASRVGPSNVAAVDPSPLVRACAALVPEADVRSGSAEALPWPDESFDAALAQLVLHFLEDPVAGLAEMSRVVRGGGTVSACSWNFPEMLLLRTFWQSARHLDPAEPGERLEIGSLDELGELGRAAGLESVETAPLDVAASYESFDELWGTFQLGVGPAGDYVAQLEPQKRDAIRDEYRRRTGDPSGSFTLRAQAWALRGRVPDD